MVALTESLVSTAAHLLPWQRAVVMSLLALHPAGAAPRAYTADRSRKCAPGCLHAQARPASLRAQPVAGSELSRTFVTGWAVAGPQF